MGNDPVQGRQLRPGRSGALILAVDRCSAGKERGRRMDQHDVEKVRQRMKTIIWFVWSVSFIWFFS